MDLQKNNIKKLLLALVLLLNLNILFAEEIKLSCDITASLIYPSGREESRKLNEIYIVTEIYDQISIIASSGLNNFPSVSSYSKKSKVINNYSNESKWDISNEGVTKEGYVWTSSVHIDRHSGQIFTNTQMKRDGGTISDKGIGICEKINVTKKKF